MALGVLVEDERMIRKLAAGLAGLGLIGGAGTVIYNHNGSTTVRITDPKTGQVQSVSIGASGQAFSCPAGTRNRLEPYDLEAGRIKLTLLRVRRVERAIERRYPSHNAPSSVARRYNALLRRDNRLVSAFNRAVGAHNAIISRDCTAKN
jgi:hypothetical protein